MSHLSQGTVTYNTESQRYSESTVESDAVSDSEGSEAEEADLLLSEETFIDTAFLEAVFRECI